MNKKFYCLLVLTIVFLTSCSERKLDLKDVLGLKIDLINKDYEYGDYLSFSGEGYTGLQYSVSETEMNSIIKEIKSQELPLKKELFKIQFWTKTPINKKSEDIIDLISSYHSKDERFLKFQKELRRIIYKNNNYFSYYYKETEGNIDDIELYLLDTTSNKIFIVRHSV
ncbi:hypothetical protein QVZ41_08735 [Wenyingzhuangia sp. chi5]|uniref:Lipoprotein n=1 Tax=Wenyingzhuangia gilva TaxID=3057677 RepID=A0ABT8VSG6_9FLAO|nr:hypothetical protein [Wenyingzhuangia sp. chi5]MDO3694927.1 hypothetical protein [Wenyingzhuangia sp. chi5]